MQAGSILKTAASAALLAVLAACSEMPPAKAPPEPPRPSAMRPPSSAAPIEPSERSRALAAHYTRVEASLVGQGLLRTDGGGPDTPYTDTDILRNFERIAFHDEYARNRGLAQSDGRPGGLRKWSGPVRMSVEFGASVPLEQREADRRVVAGYAARLARVTGHPISAGAGTDANFNVLFMGEDDRAQAVARIKALVPNINQSSIDLFESLPRSIHCLVVAFSGTNDDHTYRRAIALIRTEHPSLLRKSCVHEELAQGLGLANDSPRARPSIFNDDDEFALLTTHDEELLRLLYSPRLKPGMSYDEARPILVQLIAEARGGSS
ncbi:hypothetical protein DC366_14930 [Pelagivirga sediminicola]|uniref:DUF2927 domain-containing protein n=1 Tax=Pelagivirga sediminicola TaxID=2170575 RepID=A0A2T7G454_9RHOB|nr:DUF2927 domain-containing protein [Pelagivirga sediminicola]PVA09199.1 hypothetical protein DC366_14930 [Pelagivirga sediminicola]